MKIGAAQIIYIAIAFISLGIEMSKHGEPKTGKYNVWTSLIAIAITFSLLFWGGFFG